MNNIKEVSIESNSSSCTGYAIFVKPKKPAPKPATRNYVERRMKLERERFVLYASDIKEISPYLDSKIIGCLKNAQQNYSTYQLSSLFK